MKKILCLVSVCVMLLLTTVASSAAGETKFKLRVVSENDTQAVLSFDFEGGASFSALDFTVEVNKDKAKITKVVDGKGLTNFKIQAQAAVSQPNIKGDVALVTAALVPGYRNVNGEDLFVITVKKHTKEALTTGDVKIIITNCQDGSFKDLTPVVSYEFAQGSSAPETPSQAPAETPSQAPSSPDATETPSAGNKNENTEASLKDSEAQKLDSEADKTVTKNSSGKDAENTEKGVNKTTVIIICVAAVVLAGGGAGAAVIIKKKKNSAKQEKEGE